MFTLGTNKAIVCAVIGEAIFFRAVREVYSWNISGYAEKLQAPVYGSGIVTPVQGNTPKRHTGFAHLFLQMAENHKTFLFICREGIHTRNNAILAVNCHFC